MKGLKWLTMTAVAAMAVFIGGACSDETGKGSSDSKPTKTGKIGQAVSNAGTKYKVVKVKQARVVGDPALGGAKAEPGATFVIITLQLTNGKKETKTFTDASAKLKAADGTSYDTSDKAVLEFGDKSLLLKEIQPDLTTTGILAFEVPKKKLKGSKLEIEDLFGNGKIAVDLGF